MLGSVSCPGQRQDMNDIATRLKNLDATLQRIAQSPNTDSNDAPLLADARLACDVGLELLCSHRIVQARYALFYGEACAAVIQTDLRGTDTLRELLNDLLTAGTQV